MNTWSLFVQDGDMASQAAIVGDEDVAGFVLRWVKNGLTVDMSNDGDTFNARENGERVAFLVRD